MPLRRTAWGLLTGGVLVTALMLGAGALAVSNAPAAGPDQETTWPAGEPASLNRIPGEPNPGNTSVTCTLTPSDGLAEQSYRVGEPLRPPATDTTITCDEPVALLTGAPRVVAEYTRGPLIALPLAAAMLGGLLFVPRFTHLMASMSTPGWMRRILRIPPPGS